MKMIFVFFLLTCSILPQHITGTGSLVDPYVIYTAANFDSIRHMSARLSETKYFKLGNDINFASYGNFKPIRDFRSNLDGQGYTISNVSINQSVIGQSVANQNSRLMEYNGFGIFRKLRNASIKNLNLVNINISVVDSLPVFTRATLDDQNPVYDSCLAIKNIYAQYATLNDIYCGILAGKVQSTVTISGVRVLNSTLSVRALGRTYAGGLIGGAIPGEPTIQSVVDYPATITHCSIKNTSVESSIVDVTAYNNNICAAGLMGQADCYGSDYTRFDKCFTDDITVLINSNMQLPGNTSNHFSTIRNIYGSGFINTRELPSGQGGFSGYVAKNCYAQGTVIIQQTGNYTYTSYAAGFISNLCYAENTSNNISSSPENENLLSTLWSWLDTRSVINCYSAVTLINTDGYRGGFCANYSGGAERSCFFDYQVAGVPNASVTGYIGNAIKSKTTTEMKTQAAFTGFFDFNEVWNIDIDYPDFNNLNVVSHISGAGTIDNPYIIYNAADLDSMRYVSSTGNGADDPYIVLGNDISFSNDSVFYPLIKADFLTSNGEYIPFVYEIYKLNGNGHILSDYTSTRGSLFANPELSNITFRNFHITSTLSNPSERAGYSAILSRVNGVFDSVKVRASSLTVTVTDSAYQANIGTFAGESTENISGSSADTVTITVNVSGNVRSKIGGLAGLTSGKLFRSSFSGDIIINSDRKNTTAAGLAGESTYQVADCFSKGSISAGDSVQAAGFIYSAKSVNTSYSAMFIYSSLTAQGFTAEGVNQKPVILKSYYDYSRSPISTEYGGAAKDSLQMRSQSAYSGFDFYSTWLIDGTNEGYPYFRAVPDTSIPADTVILCTGANNYTCGQGTADEPYIICSVGGLDSVRYFPTAYFELGRNIDLTGVAWVPLPEFNGVFDGKNYTIKKLTIDGTMTNRYTALFSYLGTGGQLKNIILDSVYINVTTPYTGDYGYLAGLAAYAIGDSITNCHLTNSVIKLYSSIFFHGVTLGGLVAKSTEPINNCSARKDSIIYVGHSSSNYGGIGAICGNSLNTTINNSFVDSCYIKFDRNQSTDAVSAITYFGDLNNCYTINSTVENPSNYYTMPFSGGNLTNCYAANVNLITQSDSCCIMANPFVEKSFANVFFDSSTVNSTREFTGVTARTNAQMKSSGTYTAWDLINTWDINSGINSGFPYLKKVPLIYLSTESVVLLYPNGNESFRTGNIISVRWNYRNSSCSQVQDTFSVYYSLDAGITKRLIGKTISNTYFWTVPDSFTTKGRVYISSENDFFSSDISDNSFEIAPDRAVIEILSPLNSSLNITEGTTVPVTFYSLLVDSSNVYFSQDSSNYYLIEKGVITNPGDGIYPDTTVYNWHITQPLAAGKIYLKIKNSYDLNNVSVYDSSDFIFRGERGRQTGTVQFQSDYRWTNFFVYNDTLWTAYYYAYAYGWYDYQDRFGLSKYVPDSAKFIIDAEGNYPNSAYYPSQQLYTGSGLNFYLYNNQKSFYGYTPANYTPFVRTIKGTRVNSIPPVTSLPVNSTNYNDVVTYNGWEYTLYNSGYIYAKNLLDNTTRLYADIHNITRIDPAKAAIFGFDEKIFLSNSPYKGMLDISNNISLPAGTIVYSIPSLAAPVNDAEDTVIAFTSVTAKRNYFRGIYPNAILRVRK